MALWFEEHPELLEKVEAEVELFPGLRVLEVKKKILIRGRLDVFAKDVLLDSYGIEIRLADNHPKTLPLVFETEGRLNPIPARHFNDGGSACLFVAWERTRHWPDPTSVASFIRGPVNSFFVGQTLFTAHGHWVGGQRSHGLAGIIESLEEELGLKGQRQIELMLGLLIADVVKGHWPCPCENGSKLRDCHGARISEFKKMLGTGEVFALARGYYDQKKMEIERARAEFEKQQELKRLLGCPQNNPVFGPRLLR